MTRYKIMPLIYRLEDWKAENNRQTITPEELAKMLAKVKLKPNKMQRMCHQSIAISKWDKRRNENV